MSNSKQYDVIILGGGMVGAALACALGSNSPDEKPLKVAILDLYKPNLDWPTDGYDMRVSALTVASQKILTHIGAWPHMLARRVCPFTDMHVWDSSGDGNIKFSSADIGTATLGHLVENRVTLGALFDQLENYNNVDYLQPVTAERVSFHQDNVELRLAGETTLKTKLIVGADGARSWLRNKTGIQISSGDYHQKGLVCTVKTEHHHKNTARQCFLPGGPIAFLPLPDGYCSIVWSNKTEAADHLLTLDDEEFIAALQTAVNNTSLAHELGDIQTASKRAAFPLKKQHAEKYCLHRMALVGDAAHTIHPLAGQGVNLGLMDIATLAEEILTTHAKNRDFGHLQILRRYERRRRGDNMLMLSSMDGFHKLFSNKNKLASLTRNFGLGLTDKMNPIKSKIIQHAMGIDKKLPLVN